MVSLYWIRDIRFPPLNSRSCTAATNRLPPSIITIDQYPMDTLAPFTAYKEQFGRGLEETTL